MKYGPVLSSAIKCAGGKMTQQDERLYGNGPRICWAENPNGYEIPENEFDEDVISSKLEKFFEVHTDIH